jgi:hypothetical protein
LGEVRLKAVLLSRRNHGKQRTEGLEDDVHGGDLI